MTRRSLSVCVRAVLLLFGALVFGALAALAGTAFGPSSADAAGLPSLCSPGGTAIETISLGDGTTTLVDNGGTLDLTSTNNATPTACGTFTGGTTNIATIQFAVIAATTPTHLVLDQTGGVFPCTVVLQGPVNTGVNTTEVDVTGAANESIAIGSNGVNLNLGSGAAGCSTYTAGTLTGVGRYVITAGSGVLTLSAGGQGGTGAPVSVPATLNGQTGSADTFVAGDSNETFQTDTAGAVLDVSQVTCPTSPCALPINESNTTLAQFNPPTGLVNNHALLTFNNDASSFDYDLTTGKTDFNTVVGNTSIPTTFFVNNGSSVNLQGNVILQGVGSGTNFAVAASGTGNQIVAGSGSETFGGDPNAHPAGTPVSGSNLTVTGGSGSDTFFVSGSNNNFVAGTGGDAFVDDGSNNTVNFSNAPATAVHPLSVDLTTGTASAPAGPANYSFRRNTISTDLSPFVQVTGAVGGNTSFIAGSAFSGFSIVGQGSNNSATFSVNPSGIIANFTATAQTPSTTIEPSTTISGFAVQPNQVLFCTATASGMCTTVGSDTLTSIGTVTGPGAGFSTFFGGPSTSSETVTAPGTNNTFLGDTATGACPTIPGCSYTITYPNGGNQVVAGVGTEVFNVTGSNMTAQGGTGTDTFNVTGSNNTFNAGSGSDSFFDNGSLNTVSFTAVSSTNSQPLFIDVNAGGQSVGPSKISLNSGEASNGSTTYTFQRSPGSNDSTPFTAVFGSNTSGNTQFFAGDTGGIALTGQGTGNTITFEGSTFGIVANLSAIPQISTATIALGTSLSSFSIPSGSVLVTNPTGGSSCSLATNSPCDSLVDITNITGPPAGFSTFIAGPSAETFTAAGATGNTVDFGNVPLTTATGCTPCVLDVNASGGQASLMSGNTAEVTYNFNGPFTQFIGYINGSTTFIASGAGLTYTGQGAPATPAQDNVLTFAQAPITKVTVYACVSGAACLDPGQAVLGTGSTTIANFSDIQSFLGLPGASPSASTTNFVIDDSQANLTFTGEGGTTTADFSPAASPVTIDLSLTTNNVTTTLGFDTISNITNVFGSSGGHNTFVAGTASSETFGDNGGTGDTLNLIHVNAGNGAVLTVNVSGVGTSDVATLQGSTVTYTFGSSVTNFMGSAGGFTTFLAGSTAGLSFSGVLGSTNNSVSFSADSGPVVVNLSSSAFGVVGPGQVLLGAGSCPTNCDTLANIPKVTGSASGGDRFVAGPGNETFLSGGGAGQEIVDFSNLTGSVVVNVSAPGQVPSGTAFGTATSGLFTYDFTNFDGSAITFEGSPGGTQFFAGPLADTFTGNPLGTNVLNFSDATSTKVTVYACVGGVTCALPGQAHLGSGTNITFSNIQSFVGLPGLSPSASTTNFVIDDSQANLTFTGDGGTTTADFSPAANPVTIDLSQSSMNVTVATGHDTISNITNVFGSEAGGNTFIAGTASSESFGDNNLTGGDTLNLTHANAGNGAVLTVNVSGVGTSDVATLQGSTVTYSFGSSVTDFIGSSGGFTTFLAGSTPGLTFNGVAGSTNNSVSFSADSGPVVVNLSSSAFGVVGPGQVLLGAGSCPTNCDTLANIPKVTGSASGGDRFVAGPGNETFLSGGGPGQEMVDFSNLPGSVVVNVSTSTAVAPGNTQFGMATSGAFTYNFSDFDTAAITFVGSPSGTQFFAGALGDTFAGNPLAPAGTNVLNFSDATASKVTVYACSSGAACLLPGQAQLGSGTKINFSNIQSFVGLPGLSPSASTTNFVIDDSQANLTFTGDGGTTTADFSPAVRPIQFDFSQATNNVTVTVGVIFPLPHLVQEPDTLTNITMVFGSSNGNNTFKVGSTSETFESNGGTNNTVDFRNIFTTNAGPNGQLIVNDSNTMALGISAFTGSFNGATYTFAIGASGFTNFIGASSGNTTFVAPGSSSGASFQGESTGNAVSFIQYLNGVAVNMAAGTVQLLNGAGPPVGTDFLTVNGGPVDFSTVVGSGGTALNIFDGALTGTKFTSSSTKNSISYANFGGPVTVDLTNDSISGPGSTDTFSFASSTPVIQGSANGADTFIVGTGAATLEGAGFSAGGDILNLTNVPPPTSGTTGVDVNLQTGHISGPTMSGITFTPCTTIPTANEVCWSTITGPQNVTNTYTLNANQLAGGGVPSLAIIGGSGTNVLDLSHIAGSATVHMPGALPGCVIAGVMNPPPACAGSSPVTFNGISTLGGTQHGGDYVFIGNGAEDLVEPGTNPASTIDFSNSTSGVTVSLTNNLGTPTGTATNALTTISDMFTGFTTIVGTGQGDSFAQSGAGSYNFVDPQGSNSLTLSGAALNGATITLTPPNPLLGCPAGSSQGTVENGIAVNDTFACMSQVSSTGSGLKYLVFPGETTTLNGGGTGTLELCVAGLCPNADLPATGVTIDLGAGTVQGYGPGVINFTGMSTVDGTNHNDLFIAGPGNITINGEGGADGISFANPDHNPAMSGNITINDAAGGYTIPTGLPGAGTVVAPFTASSGFGTIQMNGISSITASPAGNDIIVAGSGPAVLIGGGGNDRFVLTGGTDYLYTGTGSATLELTQLAGVTSLNLGDSGLQSLGSGSGFLQLLGGNINSVFGSPGGSQIWGGNGNLTVTGGPGNDYLAAGSGNQTLVGGGGLDTLVGGVGNDTLIGGSQPVTFVPGSGSDVLTSTGSGNTLSYQGAPNPVDVNLGPNTSPGVSDQFAVAPSLPGFSASGGWTPLPGGFANLTNAGITQVIGTAGNDILVAGTGDTIQGNGGNDVFVVNGGNNNLTAGSGTHSIFVFVASGNNVINGGGQSTVDFSQSTTAVTVNLQSGGQATGGFGGFQALSGILNIVGARASHNVLIAGPSGGTVTGLGTNDFLQSGPQGGDTLINDGPFGDTFCAQSSCASPGTTAGGGNTLEALHSTSGNTFFTHNGVVDIIEVLPNSDFPPGSLVTDPNDKIVIV